MSHIKLTVHGERCICKKDRAQNVKHCMNLHKCIK